MPFPPAHPGLLQALAARGYLEPTPVQAAVMSADAGGHDLLVSARTGSGKTVAYGLALAETLLGTEPRMAATRTPRALVIAPTRELAFQVQTELAWLFAPTGAQVLACVGGMDPRREQRALAQGAAIVVGTPGRLRDHVERKNLVLGELAAVVLDEADEMLDLGFREELEAILDATPTTRRTLLFSATLPRAITTLAKRYQRDALRISTGDDEQAHGDIEYRAVTIHPRERDHVVVNLLRYFEVGGALVFCNTRDAVGHLSSNLLERGFAVVALSGEHSQAERTRALQALRDGRARVCVATDVAARGLDLPDLGLVVHADPPRDRATLLHRSGRTGRAGRKGTTVVLVPPAGRGGAARLFAAARVEVEWSAPPSADEIRERDQLRLADEIAAMAADAGDDEREAGRALLAQRTPEEIAAALVLLHRAQRPAPEEVTAVPDRPVRDRPVREAAPHRGPTPHDERGARARGGDERGARAKGGDGDGDRRPRRPPSGGGGEAVWFRVGLGRIHQADPRWLIPLLCNRGDVTRHAIGAIRIAARETLVEISGDAAAGFAAAIQRPAPPGARDRHVRIEPAIAALGDQRK